MIDYLLRACSICEPNAVTAMLRNVVFKEGRLSAFNGLLQYQAPSSLDAAEPGFEVSHEKLASAIRQCGEHIEIDTTGGFLRLKHGPFKVRVRKIDPKVELERISLPPSAKEQRCPDLIDALKRVRDFISTDASRPWSVSALVRDGFIYATNNLALVRSPISMKVEMTIPRDAVSFLCDLPAIDHYHVDDRQRLIFSCGRELMRCPQSSAPWPDMSSFFEKLPTEMPEIPAVMKEAATAVGRFADRHVSLGASSIESKTANFEAEYEVDFTKGAGVYNARLLSLILEHATHADFSYYPAPIFFRGEALEGTAVGVRQA